MTDQHLAPVDPASHYKITLARKAEHDGKMFWPRTGYSYEVSGAVVDALGDAVKTRRLIQR